MDLRTLGKLQKLYASGKNISQILREQLHSSRNSPEIIQISYDFQAGSYIRYVQKNQDYISKYTTAISREIQSLAVHPPYTLLEVGVGEATTFAHVLKKLKSSVLHAYGFDISWSRLAFGRRYLKEHGLSRKTSLFMADLFSIPLADNSIDIVYTAHSIEPNGGKEKEILQELYRVASQYLVLLEPSYHFANSEAKKRMKQHGFITRLPEAAKELGLNIVSHRLFDVCSNPLNPTGLLIIKTPPQKTAFAFRCPISGDQLKPLRKAYFSKKGLLAYPVLDEIPCLLPQNAIIATHFDHFT